MLAAACGGRSWWRQARPRSACRLAQARPPGGFDCRRHRARCYVRLDRLLPHNNGFAEMPWTRICRRTAGHEPGPLPQRDDVIARKTQASSLTTWTTRNTPSGSNRLIPP